jgi:hypothetical protein
MKALWRFLGTGHWPGMGPGVVLACTAAGMGFWDGTQERFDFLEPRNLVIFSQLGCGKAGKPFSRSSVGQNDGSTAARGNSSSAEGNLGCLREDSWESFCSLLYF